MMMVQSTFRLLLMIGSYPSTLSEVIHNVHTEYITPLCFYVFGMFISYKGQVLLIQIFSYLNHLVL